jgi:hypothetical protein
LWFTVKKRIEEGLHCCWLLCSLAREKRLYPLFKGGM